MKKRCKSKLGLGELLFCEVELEALTRRQQEQRAKAWLAAAAHMTLLREEAGPSCWMGRMAPPDTTCDVRTATCRSHDDWAFCMARRAKRGVADLLQIDVAGTLTQVA